MPDEITLTVDGVTVAAKPGQTVLQASLDAGIYIPYLCYWPGIKPYGACRMCVVEVEGQKGTPASCTLPVGKGMVVRTKTSQLEELRRSILEMLLSEHPHGCLTCHRIELCGPQDICLRHVRVTDRCVVCPKNERCELKDTVRFAGVNMETSLTYNYRNLPIEVHDPFYDRDYNLCIVCGRCVRVCEEVRADNAIAFVERSGVALVGTSRGTSLLESGCEFCGACIDVCPVGALVERRWKWEKAARTVTTTCPHCSVGCQMRLEVDRRGRVIRSIGDWSAEANRGQLCFKGKFGLEFVNDRRRLTRPLVARHGKLEEAGWDEALAIVAQRLKDYKGDAYAMLVSPRATNEEAYLASKFARVVMGTNNVDVSSNARPELVMPLGESMGHMAATGSIQELEDARCVLVVNSNTTEDHNVAAVPLKKGHNHKGLKLIVVDTREVELTRYADVWLRPRPGTEVMLLGGMLRVILDESLEDKGFVASRCDGWSELSRSLARFDLLRVEDATGVPQASIREAARLFAKSRPGAILYALDNVPQELCTQLVRALANLALMTGNIGKPSSGLFPLRSGTNEQGAWDVGCTPSFLPGYAAVQDAGARQRLEAAWRAQLPANRGLGMDQVFDAIRDGRVKAVQVIGDSSSFHNDELEALSKAEFLVVHETFLSDLARMAHVVFPTATFAQKDGTYTSLERRVQLLRPAVAPREEERADWLTICKLARLTEVAGFDFHSAEAVWQEIASQVPFYAGISYGRLRKGGLQWPCPTADHPGTARLYADGFAQGKVRLMPLEAVQAPAITGREFPLLFAPGRVLAQADREMEVARGEGLNFIRREELVQIHSVDAASLGVAEDDLVEVVTVAGRLRGRARLDGALRGVIFSTALFGQLATQLQASSHPDPMLRVPGLDILPARLEKANS